MKIALVAPGEETVPPQRYGGTEWIIYYLAHFMSLNGHSVHLYAPGNSQDENRYTLIPIPEHSLRSKATFREDLKMRETAKLISMAEIANRIRKEKYDIVHSHASWRFLLFKETLDQYVLTTQHGPLSIPYQNLVFLKYKNQPYVSISNNQRRDLPELNFITTIYNGIDLSFFPFYNASNTMNDYTDLLFLARMSDEKGAIEAAMAAERTQKNLKVTAKVDTINKWYYEKFKKLGNKYIEFLGEIGYDKKISLLQHSRCLIVPIKWEEPFGLMFIEAMACGTPVVTFSRGAAPEIIIDGKTGFLINQSKQYIRGNFIIKETGIDGLCEAIDGIFSLSEAEYREMRRACREHVEKNFTVERMVNEYEKVYEKILSQ